MKLTEYLAKGTEESTGVQSNIRQLTTIVGCALVGIMLIISLAWFVASMASPEPQLAEVPGSVVAFLGTCGGIFGTIAGLKVVQQKNEQ